MKKLKTITFVIGLILFISNTASAQWRFENYTNCDMEVTISYGPLGGSCDLSGSMSYPVPAYSIRPVFIPLGHTLKLVRGRHVGNPTCAFTIAINGCYGLPYEEFMTCSSPSCNNYHAYFIVGGAVAIPTP